MIILLTGLQAIPPHLYEAARIDGAPARARFWRITLPLLRPSLFLCGVVGILNSFTAFDLVYVMTQGGPDHATELLITYIYREGFGETRFDYAAALTIVQFALLLALTWLAHRAAGRNAGALECMKLLARSTPAGPDLRGDAGAVLLGAEDVADRRKHLRLSAALIPHDANLFHYVDVWYFIPFPRYLLNSVAVSVLAVIGNLVLNALAGYALAQPFVGRQTIILLLLELHADSIPGHHHPRLSHHRAAGAAERLSRPRSAAALHHHLHLRLQIELRSSVPLVAGRRAKSMV